ncbi:MAG: class I SAM-dependent methyltransferase [Myxococcota bacterium]
MPFMPRRGRYGIDAPYVPLGFAVAVLAALGLAAWGLAAGAPSLATAGLVSALWFGLSLASYLYTTLRGKLAVWSELVDGLALAGHEKALDVGCGRGAVLLEVARRLPRGKAVGIDLWRSGDQSGNAQARTLANAEAEGVAARVELATGDMRALPYADASFDLVVSSLAVHNVPDAAGRALAVAEMWRVLAPGGRLLIVDFRFAADYAAALAAVGATAVTRRGLGWRFWFGGPWAGSSLVTAAKAPAPARA